jgi:diaminopimelate epimerase
MQFEKFEALGNDFIIVRESEAGEGRDFSQLALQLCDRHFGVGADGVEMILENNPSSDADLAIRLYNSDGGETPISGNGTRCVAAWFYLRQSSKKPHLAIETAAGRKTLSLKRKISEFECEFEMEMGKPFLASSKVPVLLEEPLERVVSQSLKLSTGTIRFTASSMGNPHCSIFMEDLNGRDWQQVGQEIEHHRLFPDRTNVEFIRVLDRSTIEVQFWERGVGRTLASGTGSCGAAIASILNDRTEKEVTVRTVAGELRVEWRSDGVIYQTGRARYVFSGDWPGGS